MNRSSGLEPVAIARLERVHFERARRTNVTRFKSRIGEACGIVVEALRLLRSAPPLGDVGTRGNELTKWVNDWNRQGNPHDSNRE